MTVADNPPSEIQTLIENSHQRFQQPELELFSSVFGDDAIIIDGISLTAAEPERSGQLTC